MDAITHATVIADNARKHGLEMNMLRDEIAQLKSCLEARPTSGPAGRLYVRGKCDDCNAWTPVDITGSALDKALKDTPGLRQEVERLKASEETAYRLVGEADELLGKLEASGDNLNVELGRSEVAWRELLVFVVDCANIEDTKSAIKCGYDRATELARKNGVECKECGLVSMTVEANLCPEHAVESDTVICGSPSYPTPSKEQLKDFLSSRVGTLTMDRFDQLVIDLYEFIGGSA